MWRLFGRVNEGRTRDDEQAAAAERSGARDEEWRSMQGGKICFGYMDVTICNARSRRDLDIYSVDEKEEIYLYIVLG